MVIKYIDVIFKYLLVGNYFGQHLVLVFLLIFIVLKLLFLICSQYCGK